MATHSRVVLVTIFYLMLWTGNQLSAMSLSSTSYGFLLPDFNVTSVTGWQQTSSNNILITSIASLQTSNATEYEFNLKLATSLVNDEKEQPMTSQSVMSAITTYSVQSQTMQQNTSTVTWQSTEVSPTGSAVTPGDTAANEMTSAVELPTDSKAPHESVLQASHHQHIITHKSHPQPAAVFPGASMEDIIMFPGSKQESDSFTVSSAAIVVWVGIVAAAVVILVTVFVVTHRHKICTLRRQSRLRSRRRRTLIEESHTLLMHQHA